MKKKDLEACIDKIVGELCVQALLNKTQDKINRGLLARIEKLEEQLEKPAQRTEESMKDVKG